MTLQTLGAEPAALDLPTPLSVDPEVAEGFVEVPARCFKIQTEPMSVEHATVSGGASGRIVAVVAVPLHAYLAGAGRPTVLNRYLARAVVDSALTPHVTHRILAVEPTAEGTGEAYVEVVYDVAMLTAALAT